MAGTQATVARHPIHPMLVVIPIGLWVTALVFDILHAVTGAPVWGTLAFYDIAAGIVGALLAAVPGFIDYFDLDGRAARIATWHMALNLGAVVLFLVNWLLRTSWGARFVGADSWVPFALSIIGVVGLAVSGWLGGEMVYVERVGVEEGRERRPEDVRRRVA
jgi:uncharacterized membrane protein